MLFFCTIFSHSLSRGPAKTHVYFRKTTPARPFGAISAKWVIFFFFLFPMQKWLQIHTLTHTYIYKYISTYSTAPLGRSFFFFRLTRTIHTHTVASYYMISPRQNHQRRGAETKIDTDDDDVQRKKIIFKEFRVCSHCRFNNWIQRGPPCII